MVKIASNRYLVLFLLTVVYGFNFIDRQILGILAPYIQADLDLTDGQLGLLAGFYFSIFYTVIGLPIAWLADRYNRVTIVSVSLGLWSAFTALSGFAANYLQLALARMGVGVGEAGGSPPSHSILSDLFSSTERAKALAIYSLGIPFGITVAYFVSAALLGQDAVNWRMVFFAIGIPGVVLALILKLVVKEPQRGALDKQSTAPQMNFLTSLKTLLKIPSYWAMCMGITLASFVSYSLSAFSVLYITRQFPEVSIRWLLIWLGIIHGVAYAGGTYLGGVVADKWGKSNRGGYALTPAIALIISLPCLVSMYWIESVEVVLVLLAVFLFCIGSYLGPSFSVAQTLAPVSMRATSTAIYFFVLNLIALGGGPTYTGWMSDYLAESYGPLDGLRWAMTSLGVVLVLAIVAFLMAAKYLPRDWAKAEVG
jgi:MFS family permease